MSVNVTEERIELTTVDKASIVVKQVQGAYKDLRSSIDTVKNALAAVGVTVGVGAMVSLYHDVLKATAALDDMAEATGSSVERLSALQRVAKVAGFEFGGVTEAMGKMIKGLKGADEQGQSAASALEFLGIKAKNADGTFRDQGEVMVEIAKKLNAYADSGNKVALVQDLYGKGAQRLLPYLKDLGEQTDFNATVTAKQAAQAEEAEKNIKRLQVTMEDARRELVIGITPAITEFTEKLLAATKASGGLIGGIATMSRAQTVDIGKRMKEIDSQLSAIDKGRSEPRTFQFGTGASEALLKQEREYLKAVQLQQALAGAEDPRNFDTRDIRNRQKGTLDYASPDKRKFPKGLSPMETRALQLEQQQAKEATGPSEFMETSLAIKAGKYNTVDQVTGKVRELTEAEKQYLLQLSAAADTERSYKELREEKLKGDEEAIALTDAQRAAQQARSQALVDSLSSETERENKEYQTRLSNLAEYLASAEGQIANGQALREGIEVQHQQNLLAIERNKHQAERGMQIGTWQLGAELLQQFAGKSRLAAIAVIAINKGLAIAQVIQSTAAAVMRGYSDLGPYGGALAQPGIEAMGALQIGIIAATGLAQAANVGGGGASVGSPANPINTTGSGFGSGPPAFMANQPQGSQTSVTVNITGVVTSEVLDQLKDQLTQFFGADGVLIPASSRQASVIATGI